MKKKVKVVKDLQWLMDHVDKYGTIQISSESRDSYYEIKKFKKD